MKYNVGNRVRIKSIDWYNKNKTSFQGTNFVDCGSGSFTDEMVKYCGEVVTIESIDLYYGCYFIKEDGAKDLWTDEMIEGLVEEETKNWADTNIPDGPYTVTYDSPSMNDSMNKNNIHNEIILPKGYIFKDENGNEINTQKIVLEKKKKEYPKTYEECCEVLGINSENFLSIRNVHRYDGEEETIKYERDLLDKFDYLWQLIICRDAYWKLYGEEMGLGKPWSPTDSDYITGRYCIFVNRGNIICDTPAQDCILTFPTAEMRDAFYENFKELIESCKELL